MLKRFVVVLLVLMVAACSTMREPDLADPPADDMLPTGDQGGAEKVGTPYKVAGQWYYPKEDPSYDQIGMASWYGDQFHGRRTANGETFNMNALTAAHKTLPMPSFVKVTNLANGRVLVLRVNDRGPFVDDRLIDVSRRAAQMLGFADRGLTRVRIQASDEKGRVISPPKLAERQVELPKADIAEQTGMRAGGATAHNNGQQYYIQLGAFSAIDNANRELARAQAAGLDAVIDKTQLDARVLYRVRLGPYADRTDAERTQKMLESRGFLNTRLALQETRQNLD